MFGVVYEHEGQSVYDRVSLSKSATSRIPELTGDEALYWMYSRNLDWGYHDHPPLIAIMVGIGYGLIKSELGVRLAVVVLNTITIALLYRLVKPQLWWHFALFVLSVPVLNLYGFIATPDVPLLLFTTVYLLCWRNFLNDDSLKNAMLLGISMAMLLWSKYQGVFIIFFTLLPMKSMWFNARYWIAALTGIIVFSPHIIWQIAQDLPTVKFHLNERNSDAWELKHILGYVSGQFLVFNPLVLVWVIWIMVKTKMNNTFEQSLRWLICGVLILFFFNSFRGRVEPHWTAPLTIAACYIIFQHMKNFVWKRSLILGLGFFSLLILLVRFALVFDVIPQFHKEFHRDKNKMLAIKHLVGSDPVCFMNSYQNPSLYMFYTGQIAHTVNNSEGGKNQFDDWQYNEFLHEKPFVFVASYNAPGFEKMQQDRFDFHVRKYDDLPMIHDLRVVTDDWLQQYHVGDTAIITAKLINQNNYPITLKDGRHHISWKAMMNHKKENEANPDVVLINLPEMLLPQQSQNIMLKFVVPDKRGKNYLYFATQIDDLPPTYQSNKIRLMIE